MTMKRIAIRKAGMPSIRTMEVGAVLNGSTMVVVAILNGALKQPERQVATIPSLHLSRHDSGLPLSWQFL